MIPYLGPAFFTKLLYFFSPGNNFFIMDQWTAKSINLLKGEEVVKLDSDPQSPHRHFVARRNCGSDYNKFCEKIDELAIFLGVSGEEIEQRLFAGVHPWRGYVINNYRREENE
jgi:hypothetical protein